MKQQGCGNAGVWTARKTRSRFSIAAHEPLEIAGAISTFPQPRPLPRGKVEIQSQDSPLSHALLVPHKIKPERRTQSPPVTLVFRLISGLENASGRSLPAKHSLSAHFCLQGTTSPAIRVEQHRVNDAAPANNKWQLAVAESEIPSREASIKKTVSLISTPFEQGASHRGHRLSRSR
jgi:hypothetical protein